MKQRLKRLFLNNFGLKALSVLSSILLWFIVVNVEDPNTTKSFTLNVAITNEDVLLEQGQYYTITGNSTIKVSVNAPRSVIEKLTASDFTATADMNYLMDDGRIPVEITVNKYASSVTLSSKQLYLYVEVGNLSSMRFNVTGLTTGTPADGHVLNSITTSPNVITVEGPEEVVTAIDQVTVICNIDGATEDITESVVPKFYDNEGRQIDTSNLTMNVTTISVTADIQSQKTVDVTITPSGELPDDLELGSITVDPSTVEIKGEADVLNEISSIVIPSTVVDLSTITSEWSTTVDLSAYLPDGVTLVTSSQSTAKITVKLASEDSIDVEIPTENLSIRNLSDGYSAAFEDTSITVTLTGTADSLSQVSAEDITGSVDAAGLTDGSSKLQVQLSLPDGVSYSTTTTNITITKDAVKRPSSDSSSVNSSSGTTSGNSSGNSTGNTGNSSSGGTTDAETEETSEDDSDEDSSEENGNSN